MKPIALISMTLLAAGCSTRTHHTIAPVTPPVFRAEKAHVTTLWRQGKLTTDEANNRIWDLQDGVKDYCSDHYCGN